MKIQKHIPDFPFDRMPWFQAVHNASDIYQCFEDLRNNWYQHDATIAQWYRRSGGQLFNQMYTIVPQGENSIDLSLELVAPRCIPHPLRDYEPPVEHAVMVINDLQRSSRKTFADVLCCEAIQNMEIARATIMEPQGHLPQDLENHQVVRHFMRKMTPPDFGSISRKIREWESALRELYISIVHGVFEAGNSQRNI